MGDAPTVRAPQLTRNRRKAFGETTPPTYNDHKGKPHVVHLLGLFS